MVKTTDTPSPKPTPFRHEHRIYHNPPVVSDCLPIWGRQLFIKDIGAEAAKKKQGLSHLTTGPYRNIWDIFYSAKVPRAMKTKYLWHLKLGIRRVSIAHSTGIDEIMVRPHPCHNKALQARMQAEWDEEQLRISTENMFKTLRMTKLIFVMYMAYANKELQNRIDPLPTKKKMTRKEKDTRSKNPLGLSDWVEYCREQRTQKGEC